MKNKIKYPLAKPHIDEKEKRYVMEVLNSGWLSLGPKYQKFETMFAKKLGRKYAAAVSSGTAGLHLAMKAAGITQGDEVITTPFSFVSSGNSLLFVGAKPVFIDINPLTYNMDEAKIEAAITDKTKAILVVHILGQPCNMDPIMEIAKKHNLKIIEDACEAIGSTYNGKMAGSFGDSAVFAFYPNKQIVTGEGGMVVTDKQEIYELCASLRNQGRKLNSAWLDHIRLGYNYRMDEMSAAVGIAQLEKFDWMIGERQKIANLYEKHLSGYSEFLTTPKIMEGNTHTWFLYLIKLNQNIDRDKLIKSLAQKEIQTRPYFPSLHLINFYQKKFGYKQGDFPISEEASDRCLALPIYVGLDEEDIVYICQTLINAIKNL